MKKLLLLLVFCVGTARADSVVQVADYLEDNSYIPLMGNTAVLLADNLLDAQKETGLHSLLLSETSVLRAIWIEGYYIGETYCDKSDCSIMWAQSNIAINPLASVTLTPAVMNFGDVLIHPVIDPVSAAEPAAARLFAFGCAFLVLLLKIKRYFHERTTE
jgi:hypothetical protein